jgi:response regulator RpfG family c-di-GMP phosphodiesterase
MHNYLPSRSQVSVLSRAKTRRTRTVLPHAAVPINSQQSSLWKSVDSSSQSRGISLLLLAGDSMHTQLVNMVLSNSRYSMHSQQEAHQSRAALAIELPDVVLLDWDSEGIDGLAVLRGLRSKAETARVPVIVMTNRALSSRWQRELAAYGVKWVLEKPIVAMGLPKLIERTIQAAHGNGPQDCHFQRSALLVECGQTASGASFKSI